MLDDSLTHPGIEPTQSRNPPDERQRGHGLQRRIRSPTPGRSTGRQPHVPAPIPWDGAAPRRPSFSGRRSWPPAGRGTRRWRHDGHGNHRGRRRQASGHLRISNWPLYMADGFVAGFQTASGPDGRLQGTSTTTRNGSPEQGAVVAQVGHRRRSGGAHPVHGVAAQATRLAQRDQRNPGGQPAEPAARPAERRVRSGPWYTAPYMTGMVGLVYTRRPPTGRSPRSTTCGIPPSRGRSACCRTPRTAWA